MLPSKVLENVELKSRQLQKGMENKTEEFEGQLMRLLQTYHESLSEYYCTMERLINYQLDLLPSDQMTLEERRKKKDLVESINRCLVEIDRLTYFCELPVYRKEPLKAVPGFYQNLAQGIYCVCHPPSHFSPEFVGGQDMLLLKTFSIKTARRSWIFNSGFSFNS
eukprot:TRINITY_DN2711_c0_g5_i1.p1 TRINITY_DN2711_c0_g5~~TRINITY_DN2711_c0_g5_i1.p1  ORF type:complete len:165 (-),score=19.30 TRINITY_DN2711_c0_g5_i1:242-736(-)